MWGQNKNIDALVEEIVALTQDRNLSKEDVATPINILSLRRSRTRVVLQSAKCSVLGRDSECVTVGSRVMARA